MSDEGRYEGGAVVVRAACPSHQRMEKKKKEEKERREQDAPLGWVWQWESRAEGGDQATAPPSYADHEV